MLSKKIKTTLLIVATFSVCACAKTQSSTSTTISNSKTTSDAKAVSENKVFTKEKDPEVQKLGRVLSSISERAKTAIPNGEPKEFLADLHKVLDAEKSFPSTDISLYTLIDKQHPIADTYVPANLKPLVKNNYYTVNKDGLSLRTDVEQALVELSKAAQAEGITLLVSSTYRSYAYQKKTYAHWVEVDGPEEADRESARPGTSQHQLGAAVDFGTIDDDFWETKMGKWLNANSETYGWSLSFPKGYEDVTGYRWECWHFRYIGKEACAFQKKWFGDIQQFMFEFIDAWKKDTI